MGVRYQIKKVLSVHFNGLFIPGFLVLKGSIWQCATGQWNCVRGVGVGGKVCAIKIKFGFVLRGFLRKTQIHITIKI